MAKNNVLRYPIIAVNDAKSKSLFDNPIGTGQSALDGILRATNTLIAGKNVVVIGYGRVGSGIAERFKGLGGRVTIIEVNPINALRAVMFGFNVDTLENASKYGDIFITASGSMLWEECQWSRPAWRYDPVRRHVSGVFRLHAA